MSTQNTNIVVLVLFLLLKCLVSVLKLGQTDKSIIMIYNFQKKIIYCSSSYGGGISC